MTAQGASTSTAKVFLCSKSYEYDDSMPCKALVCRGYEDADLKAAQDAFDELIAMFWSTEGVPQKINPDWAKQNIKSIKAPILVRFNNINVFTPNGTKEIEFLGFGEDMLHEQMVRIL